MMQKIKKKKKKKKRRKKQSQKNDQKEIALKNMIKVKETLEKPNHRK